MFPMEIDHQMLDGLPPPTDKGAGRVFDSLQAVLSQRIVPYFQNYRGTDANDLASVSQNLFLRRLEDEDGKIRLASLLVRASRSSTVLIHERLFDHMAFVLPPDPEPGTGNEAQKERQLLAFAEFMLRHQFEHLLHPEADEEEVILSDARFAMDLRRRDPTAYLALRNALSDKLNGIRGKDYLALLDLAEQEKPQACRAGRILSRYLSTVVELPGRFLVDIFPGLDAKAKMRVIGECYRKSRSDAYPLVRRAASLRKVLRLFALAAGHNADEAMELFRTFQRRWGLLAIFQEMDLSEKILERKDVAEQFEIFRESLEEFSGADNQPLPEPASTLARQLPGPAAPQPPPKTLKERIEEARTDPHFPRPVIDLIEKNKMNATGQSGAKYSELIETLLAIPWRKIRKIRVSPEEFEDGLNRSHYGLKKPKELICDFFANLIWRYRHFRESDSRNWRRTGSALLFVGPPGVGKTSLAISIARNLGIPYHKLSLGGMKDEADIRGYGFTYEGSKPGPIVQGLIKMGVMNGMFIMDEADKTEKFAIATLLEILDPEQNHLFHDKYTQSTIDIDVSNCHFILTANTLDTVPPAVLNRCEVIFLDRYSVEEKIAICRDFLVQRIRERYLVKPDEIYFDPDEEKDILRRLVRNYTFEAGVRDLERTIRTLFLRVQRKEIMGEGNKSVRITMNKVRKYLEEPGRPRLINEDDRVGEMMGLGVNMEMGIGGLIPIQATPVKAGADREERGGFLSMLHTTGNIERVMDESRKVALTAILHRAEDLGIDASPPATPVHLHFMGGSTKKDGPSAGGAIALALASLFSGRKIRRDVAMTGEIDTQGRITGVGGLGVKLETAYAAGCKTLIIPRENLHGMEGIERLPEALKHELQILTYGEWKGEHEPFDYARHIMQVVGVEDVAQAADIALIGRTELDALDYAFEEHARRVAEYEAGEGRTSFRRLRIVYIDNPDDLHPGIVQPGPCGADGGCVLLARSDIRDEIASRISGIGGDVSVRGFDPATQRLASAVEEILRPLAEAGGPPLLVSVLAPLAFLQADPIRADELPAGEDRISLRLFATSCTIENMPIGECMPAVARIYLHLAHLGDDLLAECPFLVKKNGVYTISVSFIPEKYRLDVQRSEEILDRGISTWLRIVGEVAVEAGEAPMGAARAR
jgi:endopeptidase La